MVGVNIFELDLCYNRNLLEPQDVFQLYFSLSMHIDSV